MMVVYILGSASNLGYKRDIIDDVTKNKMKDRKNCENGG